MRTVKRRAPRAGRKRSSSSAFGCFGILGRRLSALVRASIWRLHTLFLAGKAAAFGFLQAAGRRNLLGSGLRGAQPRAAAACSNQRDEDPSAGRKARSTTERCLVLKAAEPWSGRRTVGATICTSCEATVFVRAPRKGQSRLERGEQLVVAAALVGSGNIRRRSGRKKERSRPPERGVARIAKQTHRGDDELRGGVGMPERSQPARP